MEHYHKPVMLKEAIEGLDIKPDGSYVDVTFGGGGHSAAILDKIPNGKLYGFDQDPDSKKNAPQDERFTFLPYNFEYLKKFLKLHKAIPVDGILADLGISSWHINKAERGFSTRFDAPLDMRMDKSSALDARTVVNTYSRDELQHVLGMYGEIPNARTLATSIVNARQGHPIETTFELRKIAEELARGKVNQYLARVFQAIRIEVNRELEVLKSFLEQSAEVLKPEGRLVVISYHSLEDRLVKNFMKRGSFTGELIKDFYGRQLKPFKVISGKPLVPSPEEIKENPRARSAKMRIAEKLMTSN